MPRKRRSPGDGSLYKRSNGLWVGSVSLPSPDGKQRRKTVSSMDRGTALKKLAELKAAVAEGVVSANSNMTVGAWLDYWIEHVRGPHVKPSTKAFYGDSIRLHIKPAIGSKRIGQLTAIHVRGMLESIDSTAAKQRAHLVLRLALKSAIKERMIRFNVTDAVDRPEHVARELGHFDAKAATHIIATAISTRNPSEATRWAAAFLTGARQGELLGLQWPRVNLEDGTIQLDWQLRQLDQEHGCGEPADPGSVTPEYPCGKARPGYCPQRKFVVPQGFEMIPLHGSLVLTRPKSKAGYRVVPLVKPLWVAFARLAETSPPNDYRLVWVNPSGRPIQPRADNRAWHELLKDAGVPPMALHAARHSTATLLQAHGVDEDTRMKITGHSSAAAHRGYIHVSQEQTRAAMEMALGDLMPKMLD